MSLIRGDISDLAVTCVVALRTNQGHVIPNCHQFLFYNKVIQGASKKGDRNLERSKALNIQYKEMVVSLLKKTTV